MSKTQELIDKYEFACNALVQDFCDKQEVDFDGWVADEIGGIAEFSSQYFFNLSDIILDLKTNQPKRKILDWQDRDVQFNMYNNNPQHINYKSYIMGLRHKQLNNK